MACSLWLLLSRTGTALPALASTDRPIARALFTICTWPSNASDEIGTINRLSPNALHLEYRVFSRCLQRKHHRERRLPPTRPCCLASRTTSRRARTSTLTTVQLSTHCNYTVTLIVAVCTYVYQPCRACKNRPACKRHVVHLFFLLRGLGGTPFEIRDKQGNSSGQTRQHP